MIDGMGSGIKTEMRPRDRLLALPEFRRKAAADARRQRQAIEARARESAERRRRWEQAAANVREAGAASAHQRRMAVDRVASKIRNSAESEGGATHPELPTTVRMLHPAADRGDIEVPLRAPRDLGPSTFSGVPTGIRSQAAAADLEGGLQRAIDAKARGGVASGAAHPGRSGTSFRASEALSTPGLLAAARSIETWAQGLGCSLAPAEEVYMQELARLHPGNSMFETSDREGSSVRAAGLRVPSGARPFAQMAPSVELRAVSGEEAAEERARRGYYYERLQGYGVSRRHGAPISAPDGAG